MSKNIQDSRDYLYALRRAKQLINDFQERYFKNANRMSIEVRFMLGRIIEENTTKHAWGKSVLEKFAADLSLAFPSRIGLSARNLSYMRQFYTEYYDCPEILDIAKDVSWRTNIIIMTKVHDSKARMFYLNLAATSMCNRDAISIQIKSGAYERGCLQDKKHNFDATLPIVQAEKMENILKGSYFFEAAEILGVGGKLLEKEIENEMVGRIKDVILMLGKGFTFMGNQYVLHAGDNTYRIDLLFFNRITQSLVAVELKMARFQAEYAGKMSLYLKLLDDQIRLQHENPSIGLILCTDRNDIEVDYVLPEIGRPIGVAELQLSKVLPDDLRGKLPDPETLRAKILQNIEKR